MKLFKSWVKFSIIITGFCVLLYFVAHQNLRQNANDPQIQIAHDVVMKLEDGQYATEIVPTELVDLSKSLNTFIIVFDTNNVPLASNAKLDNTVPTVPEGVLVYAQNHGENRLTWQPKPGVRIATIVTKYSGKASGTVLVGRSLTEVEKREDMLLNHIILGWLAITVASFVALMILG